MISIIPYDKAKYIEWAIARKNLRKASATIVWLKPIVKMFGQCEITFISYKREYPKKKFSSIISQTVSQISFL